MRSSYAGRHVAARRHGRGRQWGIRSATAGFLAVLVAFTGGQLALADRLISDGDSVDPFGSAVGFGTVCKNVPTSHTVRAAVNRNGSDGATNTFANNAVVAVSVSSSDATRVPSVDLGTITMPSNWSTAGNNTHSASASGSVTFTSATTGAFSGTLTFSATGKNADGNTITKSDSVSYSATVSACDTTPPDTVIDSSPSALSTSTTASFTFHATETSTFECQLDSGSFASCTSGKSYTSLSQGSHTFSVRATDTAGNVDPTPASVTWSVDSLAPDTTITASTNSSNVALTSPTNQQTAKFTFTASEPASFECKLDAAAYSACTSSTAYGPLGDGSHTFSVRSTDTAGNSDATPATFTWTIDATPPAVSAPDLTDGSDTGSSMSDNKTKVTTPTLVGTAEPGATVELLRDSIAIDSTTADGSGDWSFTSEGLADGTYDFAARATDGVGNSATSSALPVLVDTTAPGIALHSRTAANSNGWNNTDVEVAWTCSDNGSGVVSGTDTITKSTEGADESAVGHCADVAGNASSNTVNDINIDKTKPVAAYVDATPSTPDGDHGWYIHDVQANFSATDSLSGFDALNTLSTTGSASTTGEGAAITVDSPAFTDQAGNTADTVESAAYQIDTTAPEVGYTSVSTPDGNDDWYVTPAVATFTATDATSGFGTSGPYLTTDTRSSGSDEGSDVTIVSPAFTDYAGNTTTAGADSSPTLKVDLHAPVVTDLGATSQPDGNAGWYKTAVTNRFAVTDAISGLSAACESDFGTTLGAYPNTKAVTTSSEGTGITVTSGSCTDAAGNVATGINSVAFDIDGQAPTINNGGVSHGTLGDNGWYVSAVTNDFSATENGASGLDGACSTAFPKSVSTGTQEGIGITVASGPCSDVAGNNNTGITSASFNIDLTAPSITLVSATPAANSNGWRNGDVTVTWACSDSGSGTVAGTVTKTVTGEGSGLSATGTCKDQAGNTASSTLSGINIDRTAPTITFVSSLPAANLAGWNRSDVTLTWSCTDGLSGTASPVTQTVSTEGASNSATGTCTDNAGNTSSDTQSGIKLDKTNPALGVTGPASGTTYDVCATGSAALTEPGYAPSDSLSGLDGTEGYTWTTPTTASGVGTYTYSAHARDVAGNSSIETRTYTVTYGSGAYSGVLQPVNPDGSSRFKLGSTVPVKFKLTCGSTPVTTAVAKLTVKQGDTSPDPGVDEAVSTSAATTGNLFRYDASGQQYIFNLNTKAGYTNPGSTSTTSFSTGTWTLGINFDDGTSRTIKIQLVK